MTYLFPRVTYPKINKNNNNNNWSVNPRIGNISPVGVLSRRRVSQNTGSSWFKVENSKTFKGTKKSKDT